MKLIKFNRTELYSSREEMENKVGYEPPVYINAEKVSHIEPCNYNPMGKWPSSWEQTRITFDNGTHIVVDGCLNSVVSALSI